MKRMLLFLAMGLLCHFAGAMEPVHRMYVFGDSYSDIGRGYVDSNGPTAVAYLAKRFGLEMVPGNAPDAATKSLNFAISGAGTGGSPTPKTPPLWIHLGMRDQVAEFAAMVRSGKVSFDPKTTVFFLAGGLNDRNLPTEATVANLEGELQSLYDLGGRRFLVAVLPEKIPEFSAVSIRLNPALREIPAEMRPKLVGAEIDLSGWGTFFDLVMEHAAQYGFTNTTDQCAGRAIMHQDATPCASPETHYFYHPSHPSTAVAKIVGDMMYDQMLGKPTEGP